MGKHAEAVEAYLSGLAADRARALRSVLDAIGDNLPRPFEEDFRYGMPSFVVPKSIYPAGYRADPREPLPFLAAASQKRYLSVYHLGLQLFPAVREWFESALRGSGFKVDAGKACYRFDPARPLPTEILGSLATRIGAAEWIAAYEASVAPPRRGDRG